MKPWPFMTARLSGTVEHALEQTVPVDAQVQVGRFRAGVAEHRRDRRQRDRRAQQPGRGVVAQQASAGLHVRRPRPCRNARLITRWIAAWSASRMCGATERRNT